LWVKRTQISTLIANFFPKTNDNYNDNDINDRHQRTMAAERKEKSGIAVGLNKGHV
jgi:hypothetical protein